MLISEMDLRLRPSEDFVSHHPALTKCDDISEELLNYLLSKSTAKTRAEILRGGGKKRKECGSVIHATAEHGLCIRDLRYT